MTTNDGYDWRRGGVVYQVYPRSFADSNGDGIGDLPGIVEKIPYIASLGVDAIWVCPFYPSPMRDFGYDVSFYRGVDPIFGTIDDFKRLLEAAHAANIKVIIDQVYSHTSEKHPWFSHSRYWRTGEYADWYVWADPKPDGGPPNNWLSVFGGSAWTWETRRKQYYLHHFLAEQPQLNFHNPAVRREMLDVARYWLDLGVDGFRLDVANYYFHDASLRDNPPQRAPKSPHRPYTYQQHLYDRSRPETLAFLGELRKLLDEKPGSFAVAEVFSDAYVDRPAEYTTGPDRLHTAYSFKFLEADAHTLSAELFREALEPWSRLEAWPSWSFSNHDVMRVASRWRLNDQDELLPKLFLTLLLALRGTIFLYQGEELGLQQADVPFERLQDPEGIRFWPNGLGRDGSRTPMPWVERAPYAGFSTVEPWLPLSPDHQHLAVDAQEADPISYLQHARRMIALRRSSRALREGAIDFLVAEGPTLVFSRTLGDERIVCVFNLHDQPLSVKGASGFGEPIDIGVPAERFGDEIKLPPYGAALFRTG